MSVQIASSGGTCCEKEALSVSLLDKTFQMQIFRLQIILNFNQKTLLEKTCEVCVFLFFLPVGIVRADS